MVEKKEKKKSEEEIAESNVTDNNYAALAFNVEMNLKDDVFVGKFQKMLAKHVKSLGGRYFNLQDCDGNGNELLVRS